MFVILALTQVLGVGTVALISHAVGRKDQQDANLIFNQSLLIAAVCGASHAARRLSCCRVRTFARSRPTKRP